MIARARAAARLTQEELASRASTSRPALSAYEHGRKSPSLDTATRILRAAGFEIGLVPRVTFTDVSIGRGRFVTVPDRLWRLPIDRALAEVDLPLHLDWTTARRTVDLGKRRERARAYEVVLREGIAADLLAYVDAVLLLDSWSELVLPERIRQAWLPVVGDADPAHAPDVSGAA